MEPASRPPPPPDPKTPVTLPSAINTRVKLSPVLAPYLGQVIEGDVAAELTAAMLQVLPKPVKAPSFSVPFTQSLAPVVWETVASFLEGQRLTPTTAEAMVKTVAGNTHLLLAGSAIRPWVAQTYTEWAIAKVLWARRHVTQQKRTHGAVLGFELYTGLPAGMKFDQFYPINFIFMLAEKSGCWSKKHSIHDPEAADLVGGFAMLLLEPGDQLRAMKFAFKGAVRTHNVALAKARGVDRQCARKFKWSCSRCLWGYDDCKMGTHPRSYEMRMCANGHPKPGRFYVGESNSVCLACRAQGAVGVGYHKR